VYKIQTTLLTTSNNLGHEIYLSFDKFILNTYIKLSKYKALSFSVDCRNNYEILKMLLDRGATIPIPHDVKCCCDDCVIGSADDSLKFSLARINAYRSLSFLLE